MQKYINKYNTTKKKKKTRSYANVWVLVLCLSLIEILIGFVRRLPIPCFDSVGFGDRKDIRPVDSLLQQYSNALISRRSEYYPD